jgi:predicted homoserine dehydrogenase-like protein
VDFYNLLLKRQEAGKPIRVGVIGAGMYGSEFLTQARFMPGIKVVAVAGRNMEKAKKNCVASGWPEEQLAVVKSASAINDEAKKGKIALVDDAVELTKADLDVVIEATGIPETGVEFAWAAIENGKHIVMVNVEADVLVGMALKKAADKKNLVYSLGYGDQPALLCDLVDWARTSGFEVVSCGNFGPFNPDKRYSTPDTGWKYYGITEEQMATGAYNGKMYNSFTDKTKSECEMAAVANACNLMPQKAGLTYPMIEHDLIPEMLKPKSEGGVLEHSGTVEFLATTKRDGTPLPSAPRGEIYLVFKTQSDYAQEIMIDFASRHRNEITDSTRAYSVNIRPLHLLGLELGISVAAVGLLGIPTGAPRAFLADLGTFAKKNLAPGEILDGEGGYAAFGKMVRASDSLKGKYLPMGLSTGAKVTKAVAKGSIVTYDDVALDETKLSYKLRRQMEDEFRPKAT